MRQFAVDGSLEGYAYSTNIAWQISDLILRRRLFPEFNLSIAGGADDLPAAVRARFDWPSFTDSANWFDTINANTGRKNAEGGFTFIQGASLQAMLGTMLQAGRAYMTRSSGKLQLRVDQARASVFTVSHANMLSFAASDQPLSTAGNRIVGKFRDLLVPAINGSIAGISFPDHGAPTITMDAPHPLAKDDRIIIGGTDTTYDTTWVAGSVPSGDQVFTFTLVSRGSNYPASVGAGGKVGLSYSRMKERAPEWNHHRNQLARGAVGVGIDRQRNKVKLEIDFATSTFDQVSRICRYERDRSLGLDAVPYVTPVSATVELDLFALDAAGTNNKPIGIDPGDVVTIDATADFDYAGTYEVIEPTFTPDLVQNGRAQAGKITLQLATFNPAYFYDTVDLSEAGWQNVPGSASGSSISGTPIDLADGVANFYSGIAASGQRMPIPDAFSPSNFLGWATAVGYVEANNQLHVMRNCDFDSNRLLSCIYSDGNTSGSNVWTGDNGYAGIVWRTQSSAAVSSLYPMSYVDLTLSGGEHVLFGSGLVPGDGSYTVQLPANYSRQLAVCLAFVKDGVETGDNDAHGFAAWVDGTGVVHSQYQDGSGNTWRAANVRLFVFAWQNNMGTVTRESSGWYRIPLATGKTLAWAGFESYDAGLNGSAPPNHSLVSTPLATLANGIVPLPSGFTSITLQTVTGPTSYQIVDHPTHGIRACYVTSDLQSLSSFEDGEGHVWYGTAAGFYLLCDTATASSSGGSTGTSVGTPGGTSTGSSGGTGTDTGGASSGGGTTSPVGDRPTEANPN